MWIKCPQCGKKIQKDRIHSSPYFPFCSKRCKLVDLDGWFKNKYKITTPVNNEKRSKDNDRNES